MVGQRVRGTAVAFPLLLDTRPRPTPALATPKGAVDLESPQGSSHGVLTLEACEEACSQTAQCDGITVQATISNASLFQCYRRGAVSLGACDRDNAYDTYTTGVPGAAGYVNHYDGNNPLNVRPDTSKRSNNYFLIIGDWGKSGGPSEGDCMDGVAKMMKAYVAKQTKAGKTLLFIAAVGDNFYWTGVQPASSWTKQWSEPYA